jgi:hypothetical protein
MNYSTRFLTRHVTRFKLVSTNNRTQLILTFRQREFSLHKNISFSYYNPKLKTTKYLKKSAFSGSSFSYSTFSTKLVKMDDESIDFKNYQVGIFGHWFIS